MTPAGAPTGEPTLRVLLVDDSREVRHLVRVGLERAGGIEIVAEGANGQEAVNLCRAFLPDAVVLDVAMPVMDGLQALPELRRHCPGVAVVILTGFDDRTMGEQCLEAGASAYLTKDGSLQELSRVLREVTTLDAAVDNADLGERPRRVLSGGRQEDLRRWTGDRRSLLPPPSAEGPAGWGSDGLTVVAVVVVSLAVVTAAGYLISDISLGSALLQLFLVPVALAASRLRTVATLATLAVAGAVNSLNQAVWHPALKIPGLYSHDGVLLACAIGVTIFTRRARAAALRQADSTQAMLATSQTLAETVDRLRAVNGALEAVNTDMRQFGFVVSHDLAEPLRTMSAFAGFLTEDYADALDDRGRSYAGHIQTGSRRMQLLIEDLSAYTVAGQQALRTGPVPLGEVLDDVRHDLTVTIDERQAVITSGPLPVVIGDRSLVKLVLQNLVSNSLKFNVSGAPRVTVAADALGGDHARIRVLDNGIGVEAEQAAGAFRLFGRLHSSDGYAGTGLGLAICKRIIERHGGTIEMAPQPSGGTVVTFTLPTVPVPAPVPAAPGPETDGPAQVHPLYADHELMALGALATTRNRRP